MNFKINNTEWTIEEVDHVWLYEYGHNQSEKEFNNEDVCEVVASSNDFINEIIQKYESKQKNEINTNVINRLKNM